MKINKKPIRVIPKLDIKGPNVVKGVQMEGLRVVGEPEQLSNLYYNDGADELFYGYCSKSVREKCTSRSYFKDVEKYFCSPYRRWGLEVFKRYL